MRARASELKFPTLPNRRRSFVPLRSTRRQGGFHTGFLALWLSSSVGQCKSSGLSPGGTGSGALATSDRVWIEPSRPPGPTQSARRSEFSCYSWTEITPIIASPIISGFRPPRALALGRGQINREALSGRRSTSSSWQWTSRSRAASNVVEPVACSAL
jgi:hypothetical protein